MDDAALTIGQVCAKESPLRGRARRWAPCQAASDATRDDRRNGLWW